MEQGRFEAMIEALDEAIAVSDSAGQLVYANAAAWGMLTPDLVDEMGLPCPLVRLFALPHETTLWSASRERWFTARSHALGAHRMCVLRDITQQRQLEVANASKDEFLAILGHELRNPLAPIVQVLHLMRLRGVQGLDRERAILDRQVKHVVRLVDDLLDLARINRGQLDLDLSQRVELADVVQQAVELSGPALERQGHELRVRVPRGAWVRGDQVRLAQVVGNLLTNAARHSEPGGEVELEVELVCGRWQLRVRDQGRGIPAEMLERVFEPFVQDPESGGAQEGLGLGLVIARRLVETHGGTLSLESPGQGQGCTFTVSLPAVRPPAPATAPPPLDIQPRRAVQLLVVDDHVDGLETLAEALELAGHHVQRATSGPDALQSARQRPPELALLDLALPGMDGYELARQLQQEGPSLKLVALTGYGRDHDRHRSREAGFDEHLVKPVEIGRLLALIESLTG